MDWTSGRLDARFRAGWTSLIAATLVTATLPSLAGSIPRTSSGKLSRAKAKKLYLSGEIQPLELAA